MAFRQHTRVHSQGANIAIGRGQLTGGNPYAGVPPTDQLTNPVTDVLGDQPTPQNAIGKPTLSQQKTMEQEQRFDELAQSGGKSTLFYGW